MRRVRRWAQYLGSSLGARASRPPVMQTMSPDVQAPSAGYQPVDAVSVQDGSRRLEDAMGALVVLCGQVPSGGPQRGQVGHQEEPENQSGSGAASAPACLSGEGLGARVRRAV